ncbi:MAG TPA: hypothetical protein VGT82_03975 [Ktedonobacteraceae bacterium]|nr:hypothetical protein [Ktedonobacteraceae bacterium]
MVGTHEASHGDTASTGSRIIAQKQHCSSSWQHRYAAGIAMM